MNGHYLELAEYLTGDDLVAFALDELHQTSGGHRGLKRSDIWKETVLKAAAWRRDASSKDDQIGTRKPSRGAK
jgi:hypothetical protein